MDENANLGAIQNIARHFPGHTVGYSDHTLPKQMETMKTAYLLGAKILEKHFTTKHCPEMITITLWTKKT